MINFLTFKANQYLRLNGLKMTESEARDWIENEIKTRSELVKGWLREFIATSPTA